MTPLDLALYTGAVYGLAWLVVRSTLAAPLRRLAGRWDFTWGLTRCVVCTGAWMALALAVVVLPRAEVFSPSARALGPWSWPVLVAWSLATTWALGRALGDAD